MLDQVILKMVMLSLGITQESFANSILLIAGILDFIAAALIFSSTPRNIGLIYMFIWGALTAIARPWSRFDSCEIFESLMKWIPEMFYRDSTFHDSILSITCAQHKKRSC